MPEETPGGMPIITPAGEMPDGTDAGNMQADATQTELEDIRKALKKANAEAASNRKALQAFQDAEAKRKEAAMTEDEKANARATEMDAKYAALEQSLRETRLNAAIDVMAKTLKFRKEKEARMLINRDALEYGDNGEWTGIEEALKALAKESPHLIEAATMPDTDGLRRNQGKAQAQDDAALRTIAERYGIQS